jgi:hypothetical protein
MSLKLSGNEFGTDFKELCELCFLVLVSLLRGTSILLLMLGFIVQIRYFEFVEIITVGRNLFAHAMLLKSQTIIRRQLSSTLTPSEKELLLLYSNKKQTPISLNSLMETGKGDRLYDSYSKIDILPRVEGQVTEQVLIQVACFLHRELPVRLAHRAVKLEATPTFIKSG